MYIPKYFMLNYLKGPRIKFCGNEGKPVIGLSVCYNNAHLTV